MSDYTITLDPARAFVGALMHLNAEAAAMASILVEPDDLLDPFLRDVLTGIKAQLAEGRAPDPVLVRCWLIEHGYADEQRNRVITEALTRLFTEAPIVASVGFYADLVLEAAYRDAVQGMASRLTQAAQTSSMANLAATITAEADRVRAIRNRLPGRVTGVEV